METEWKTDQYGQRYRETALGHREYEAILTLSGGVKIPASQLADYHRRQKDEAEKRRQDAMQEMQNRPTPKSCPFANGSNTLCKMERCKIFLDGKCSLAIIADAVGAKIVEAPTNDEKKCPFSIYGKCDGCALYNNGCAVNRIAAAHKLY